MKNIICTLLILSCLFSSCTKEEAIVETPVVVNLYYRLEMVDMDSAKAYSNVTATKTSINFAQSKVQGLEIPMSDNDDDDDDNPKNFCMNYPNSIKCRTLPSLLEYFRIDKVGSNRITIKWKSIDEINFKTYNVQRSSDAKTYKKIAEVKAKGSSSEYSYTDIKNK